MIPKLDKILAFNAARIEVHNLKNLQLYKCTNY